ncbi:glycoside hydrolase family 88 protein [Segatella paludivivens]|uniref:glycoside hydrolase family 88 protein n=1 Tax=Segatella paludivivens TaxID=185294 RepID=UPI00037D77C1|nr:glycoside hydrolase family 88 protein [Segatella paludivivens]
MKKLMISTMLMLACTSCLAFNAQQKKIVEMIGKVNDYWQSHHKPETRAFWDNAAYHTGNIEAYKLTSNKQWLEYSTKWAEHNKWMGATEKDASKWKYKLYGEDQQHVLFGDWQVCFQTYIDLCNISYGSKADRNEMLNDFRLKRALEVMGYEANSKAHDYWWWADALYMVMPVMTKMYNLTGDEKYLDKLYDNICYSDSIMLDKKTGLYFRDGKYVYPRHKTNSGKKDFWARGDGWVLAGLAKVLQDMPHTYRHYDFFIKKYITLADAVAKLQQKEGYWTRSMMDPSQAPGPETSGTAFFTYGMLWGVNNGVLDAAKYRPVINRAWKYLSEEALQSDGKIGYVQPIGEKAIPGQVVGKDSEANFGTGAFLLAACEYVKYIGKGLQRISFNVHNGLDFQVQRLAEVSLDSVFAGLGCGNEDDIIVRDAHGNEIEYQKSYNGKLLVDASVRPNGNAVFYVERGQHSAMKNFVYGACYKIRKDDIAWENDRGIYRAYGPALQRSGEKAYGFDVWIKNTPELVMDKRYKVDYDANIIEDSLYRIGKKEEARAIDDATSFHYDHGNGMDCYSVGPTLGCGTPALMKDGNMIMPYCYKDYEILDNGPLRFTVRLDFNPVSIGNDKNVVEHRLISLDKGSNFNKITVWYDGMKSACKLVTGVVLHSSDGAVIDKETVLYADPTDDPDKNNSQIYVGVLFPNGNITTKLMTIKPENGIYGHAVGIKDDYRGEKFTYLFGSAWSKYDVRNMQEWIVRSKSALTVAKAN